MKKAILMTVFLLIPGFCMADHHSESIVEMWKCELKEGKKMEDVDANNKKWLAMTRKVTGSEEVQSFTLNPVVGSQNRFMFADVFPDMAAWAKAKSADETEEGKAINATFDELLDCAENRLFTSERTSLE